MRFVLLLIFHLLSLQVFAQDKTSLCHSVQACRSLSQFEKIGLQALQLQCEASLVNQGCNELAKKVDQNKLKNCKPEQICQTDTASVEASCFIGGVNFVWDAAVGIVTAPYQVLQLIADSFAKDRACFENQNGAKESLIQAFDSVIPEEHNKFRISPEIKSAMIKDWSCRDIQNHLMVKTKNYQSYLGPLIASGKYKASKDPSPLVKIVDGIRQELGLRWDCYTPAAKAEMNCYILSSVLTGGVGAGLTLQTKLKSFGVTQASIVAKIPKNPQLAIWKLKSEGNFAKAQALESKLIQDLESGNIAGPTTPVGVGINGAQYVKLDNGLEGIWKPKEVMGRDLEVAHDKGAKYEVAAFVIDRKLGLDAVPITVQKILNGQEGSLQLRVVNLEKDPGSKRQLALFDDLIANTDRHSGNILISENRVVAIDHGYSFDVLKAKNKEYYTNHTFRGVVENHLMFHRAAPSVEKKSAYFEKIQAFMPTKESYERLVNTKADEWKKDLGPHLSSEQIRGFLERRNQIIDVVEETRKELGDRVFSEKKK